MIEITFNMIHYSTKARESLYHHTRSIEVKGRHQTTKHKQIDLDYYYRETQIYTTNIYKQ